MTRLVHPAVNIKHIIASYGPSPHASKTRMPNSGVAMRPVIKAKTGCCEVLLGPMLSCFVRPWRMAVLLRIGTTKLNAVVL
jgi:hypothetical protein